MDKNMNIIHLFINSEINCFKTLLLFLLLYLHNNLITGNDDTTYKILIPTLISSVTIPPEEFRILFQLINEKMKQSDNVVRLANHISTKYRGVLPYEVGYLVANAQDRYLKMINLYNITLVHMKSKFWKASNSIVAMTQIRHLYTEIQHLANMDHEVERKYRATKGSHSVLPWDSHGEDGAERKRIEAEKARQRQNARNRKKDMKFFNATPANLATTPKKRKSTLWPLDYGWEIEHW